MTSKSTPQTIEQPSGRTSIQKKESKAPLSHSNHKKLSINRTFYEDRMDVPYGKKRLTAMAYTYFSQTGELRYAASLFRGDFPNEMEKRFLNKKNLKRELRKTALDRLKNKYLTLTIPKNFEMPLSKVYRLVRKAVALNGAYRRSDGDKKKSTTTATATTKDNNERMINYLHMY